MVGFNLRLVSGQLVYPEIRGTRPILRIQNHCHEVSDCGLIFVTRVQQLCWDMTCTNLD